MLGLRLILGTDFEPRFKGARRRDFMILGSEGFLERRLKALQDFTTSSTYFSTCIISPSYRLYAGSLQKIPIELVKYNLRCERLELGSGGAAEEVLQRACLPLMSAHFKVSLYIINRELQFIWFWGLRRVWRCFGRGRYGIMVGLSGAGCFTAGFSGSPSCIRQLSAAP